MAVDTVVYGTIRKKEKNGDYLTPLPPPCPKGLGVRHTQTLILFICLTIGIAMRSQLGVIMVAMVDNHHNTTCAVQTNTTYDETVAECNNYNATMNKWNIYRTYDWNKSMQEIITFALFTGYTSMMIPAGLLAQKYGGKIPIMVTLAINGIMSICMPWIPLLGGWIAMAGSRLILGMTQSALYPSIHTMLGKWAPLSERGRLCSYIYTGSQFGTVLAFQLSGFLASSPMGWPSSFWLFGTLSLVSCVLLGFFGSATPHEHPRITTEELAYIMNDGAADVMPKKRRTPWRHILSSPAVWGTVVSHAGSAAGYVLILTEIPLYMNNVLQVDIKRNGVYSSLPYIAMYFTTIVFGYVTDFLIARKIMSVANVRRMANSIGLGASGFFLVAFGFVQSTNLAIILMVLTLSTHAGVHVGFHVNYIDLAPNFAGPLMSLGNGIGALNTLLVPLIVSNIVNDDVTNQHKWQIVFIIFAGYQFVANIIFVTFVKGTVQPWNFYGDEENDTENELAVIEDKKCKEKQHIEDDTKS